MIQNVNQKKISINKSIRINDALDSNYIEYKSNGDKDGLLSTKEHLDEIKPYLSDIINYHKIQCEWKIKLSVTIKFFSSKDSEKTSIMYSLSNNREVIIGSETD